MQFSAPLAEGRLIRRYKRFLADIDLGGGEVVTAHCANPGAMVGLTMPGAPVYVSVSENPKRKLRHSWEIVEAAGGGIRQLVGINTIRPNLLAAEAMAAGRIAPLRGYGTIRPEVAYGRASRVDFLLTEPGRPPAYVEIKNSHLMRVAGLAEFPDCITVRAARHLDELGDMVEAGYRAVLVQVIQMHAEAFRVAGDYDPVYAAAFIRARARGVEAYAFRCRVTAQEIVLTDEVPIVA